MANISARLGDACIINGKDVFEAFNADLKSVTRTASDITTDFVKALGGSDIAVLNHKFGTGGVQLVFYVGSNDGAMASDGLTLQDECNANAAKLVAECSNCNIRIGDNMVEYVSVLTAYKVDETGIDGYVEVELTFAAVKRLPKRTVVANVSPYVVNNFGSISSGMRITVNPTANIAEAVVCGVTLKNLVSGKKFVIDGLTGKVTNGDVNAFLDTDLIAFPMMGPGMNNITFSNASMVVQVEYYPTFVM